MAENHATDASAGMSAATQTAHDRPRRISPFRWWVVVGLLVTALVAALVFGRGIAAGRARLAAKRQVGEGAIAAAQRWLAWAERLSAGDHRTDLAQAACFRRLGETDAWRTALEAAERNGAEPASLQLERSLGSLRWGQVERVAPSDYDALVAAGAAPGDAMHAVVHGLLAKGARSEAQQLLGAWDLSSAEPAEAAFLRGVCSWSAGNLESAQAAFQQALEYQPAHEMAHASLGRLLEQQHRLQEALVHDAWLASAAPDRESVRVDLARTLRKMARVGEARRVLGVPGAGAPVSARLALEFAELEFESGNYRAARDWFDKADLNRPHAPETLRAAAASAALLGDWQRAEGLRLRVEDAEGLARRRIELERRLGIDPSDVVAAQELQQVSQRSAVRGLQGGDRPAASEASPLFVRHCAGCHGDDGSASARAARHLHPRPRNLRADKYRLVSTLDHIPTLRDLKRVIRDGMPGSSMPSFAKLTDGELTQLAREVEQLYRQRFPEPADRADEPLKEIPVPAIGPADEASIELGKKVYFQSGCHHCHGDDGTASAAGPLCDDEGRPTAPRNLVYDPMKGGSQAQSLYRRIRLGMPGTPHPASPVLNDGELIALVHFCQSLAREPQHRWSNHQRAMRAVRRNSSPMEASPTAAAAVDPR